MSSSKDFSKSCFIWSGFVPRSFGDKTRTKYCSTRRIWPVVSSVSNFFFYVSTHTTKCIVSFFAQHTSKTQQKYFKSPSVYVLAFLRKQSHSRSTAVSMLWRKFTNTNSCSIFLLLSFRYDRSNIISFHSSILSDAIKVKFPNQEQKETESAAVLATRQLKDCIRKKK